MKIALLLLATLSMAACSTLNSAPGTSNQSDKPYSLRVFDANSPYHGG
ncbi:hypothetical protein [Noviherbaspirillum pedocola]|uniref:Lipoprotein n=1 Tax=Noviherbaspirillum pedocola TaxID=2801341 RepID=A0A934SR74_9BURK|nr:hypothetical protein [Noviherbaspirillum pedocola]MBK4735256.1 hypothetical protein [Noviherbaspirillum pedocola]